MKKYEKPEIEIIVINNVEEILLNSPESEGQQHDLPWD